MALTELARFLPRQDTRNRFLRSGMRGRLPDRPAHAAQAEPGYELPPGATFDPDPNSSVIENASSSSAAAPASPHSPLVPPAR